MSRIFSYCMPTPFSRAHLPLHIPHPSTTHVYLVLCTDTSTVCITNIFLHVYTSNTDVLYVPWPPHRDGTHIFGDHGLRRATVCPGMLWTDVRGPGPYVELGLTQQYICMCACVCACVCVYVHVCIRMCICISICIYMHMYMHKYSTCAALSTLIRC